MTVRQLRAGMDCSEFVLWSRYYMRRDADRELAEMRAGG
jgi:hypothetical protein